MSRCYIGLIQSLDPLRRLILDVRASGGLKCPNCDDQGFTVEAVQARTPYSDHGDDFELEQVQCEFCYTVQDSIFNRRMADNPTPLADGS